MTSHRIVRALLLAALGVAALGPVPAQAAAVTLYVDGKTGNDADDGRSTAAAFRTIARAASALPAGSLAAGSKVVVKGYTDYVYRERAIPAAWNRRGAAGAPIKFQASGYVAGSAATYVKPIVSGGDVAPKSGQRWVPSGTAGVWKTPWPDQPFGYGTYSGPMRTALFQNTTTWLWEKSSLSELASQAKIGAGGYLWSGGYLYASAVGSPSAGATDPSRYSINVIMRHTFFFQGSDGVGYVEVRGFDVRHSANGIAFAKGMDYGTAADNRVTGNLPMGIGVSGRLTSSGADPAVGANISRNTGGSNTLQAVKLDEGTQSARVCDNSFTRDGLQGIKVQGPRAGSATALPTKAITICNNTLSGHDFNPSGSPYNNANGLTIANGAREITVEGNKIFGNDVGIHISQETTGRARMDAVVLRRNELHGNRRFGIFFYDGSTGTAAGAGAMRSEYDVVWGNGIGIQVGRGSTNKTIIHASVFDNVTDGIKVGEGGLAAASATVAESLVTHNGGYGLTLVAGSSSSVRYTGFSSNASGSIKGTPSRTGVNGKAPGYRSTSSGNADFLKISTGSYQYTAGSKGGPVGARY